MSNFIGRPPFSNSLWVGIETMQFHIAQTKIFLRTPSFPIQGVPMNNLAPMKNCPGGVQGNLNWTPGYSRCFLSPANSWPGLGFFPSKGGKCMGYYSFDLRSQSFSCSFLKYCISRDVMQSNFFFPRGQVLVFIKD